MRNQLRDKIDSSEGNSVFPEQGVAALIVEIEQEIDYISLFMELCDTRQRLARRDSEDSGKTLNIIRVYQDFVKKVASVYWKKMIDRGQSLDSSDLAIFIERVIDKMVEDGLTINDEKITSAYFQSWYDWDQYYQTLLQEFTIFEHGDLTIEDAIEDMVIRSFDPESLDRNARANTVLKLYAEEYINQHNIIDSDYQRLIGGFVETVAFNITYLIADEKIEGPVLELLLKLKQQFLEGENFVDETTVFVLDEFIKNLAENFERILARRINIKKPIKSEMISSALLNDELQDELAEYSMKVNQRIQDVIEDEELGLSLRNRLHSLATDYAINAYYILKDIDDFLMLCFQQLEQLTGSKADGPLGLFNVNNLTASPSQNWTSPNPGKNLKQSMDSWMNWAKKYEPVFKYHRNNLKRNLGREIDFGAYADNSTGLQQAVFDYWLRLKVDSSYALGMSIKDNKGIWRSDLDKDEDEEDAMSDIYDDPYRFN